MTEYLYKYISNEHVELFLGGQVIFRNLRCYADLDKNDPRSDARELQRLFRPNLNNFEVTFNDITLSKLDDQIDTIDITQSANNQYVYLVSCFSLHYKESLYERFQCGSCIRIPKHTFEERLRNKLNGFSGSSIQYYDPEIIPSFEQRDLIFLQKEISYQVENEFRYWFTIDRHSTDADLVLSLKPSSIGITSGQFFFRLEKIVIQLESLHDICEVLKL